MLIVVSSLARVASRWVSQSARKGRERRFGISAWNSCRVGVWR
jgi:hypothetical protein